MIWAVKEVASQKEFDVSNSETKITAPIISELESSESVGEIEDSDITVSAATNTEGEGSRREEAQTYLVRPRSHDTDPETYSLPLGM